MLNKPAGLISSTEEGGATVMTLLPPSYSKRGFFPCGRLDRDTLGLLLITNDGQTAHELLSPKKHVMKTYRYGLDLPLDAEGKRALELGADIGGYVTSPAQIAPDGALSGEITISEGKFHQIKRMVRRRRMQGGIARENILRTAETRPGARARRMAVPHGG